MYRVMIIDDEKALRSLLKAVIDWESYGMEIVGEAASGTEAINIIDDLAPHVVFADIRMPFMDGLEFAELAKERYPKLKIVILTAYEDFEYARRCISLGTTDYLLKPVNRKEIDGVLKRIRKKLDEESPEEETAEPEKMDRKGNMEMVREYLEESYQDCTMNLTSVAQHFGFHPSYLSRKFKEEIGRNMIDYLTAYRIEKAHVLAEKGDMMYIAAKEVGIQDPNYFGKCFKKYTGVSYSEYMKRAGGNPLD